MIVKKKGKYGQEEGIAPFVASYNIYALRYNIRTGFAIRKSFLRCAPDAGWAEYIFFPDPRRRNSEHIHMIMISGDR
jgi:hypothetical protein